MSDGGIGLKIMWIWGDEAEPEEVSSSELVYCWNGYNQSELVRSIPHYIELHSDRLRTKYLAFIHELGESQIGDKRLIDHLSIDDGFSYWWMTLFVEKSLYKSPITDVIRILALEEIIVRENPGKIKLVSANRFLHEVLSDLCNSLGIIYECDHLSGQPSQRFSFKRIYKKLPDSMRALVSFARYLFARWSLRNTKETIWSENDNSIFFCSQFSNLALESFSTGKFKSDLWKGLPELLETRDIDANWLQLFVPHEAISNQKTAMEHLNHFNKNSDNKAFHNFLDAKLSLRIVVRVLTRWFWLKMINFRLGEIKNKFRLKDSHLCLWPIMKKDWLSSIHGQVAINNLLWIELFDVTLKKLPIQKLGFYLCENQAWERALTYFWHKHGHGQLVAVAHSTVRYWDLRHYSDLRTIQTSASNRLPQADLMALNGKAAVDAYLSANFPKETIVESEALRYGYLNEIRSARSPRKTKEDSTQVLILGDYTSAATIKMLQLLEAAVPYISSSITYTMKPHPNFRVKAEDYPSLNLMVVMEPLGKILQNYDVAYSSNMTSAAVDAHLAGLPSVVILDKMELNFSPLRGRSHVCFVSSKEELAVALQNSYKETIDIENDNDFFFLDPELPRWQQILSKANSA